MANLKEICSNAEQIAALVYEQHVEFSSSLAYLGYQVFADS